MRYHNVYSRLERTIYEFDASDIERALLQYAKLNQYEKGRLVALDIDTGDEDNNYKLTATVTLTWEKPEAGE